MTFHKKLLSASLVTLALLSGAQNHVLASSTSETNKIAVLNEQLVKLLNIQMDLLQKLKNAKSQTDYNAINERIERTDMLFSKTMALINTSNTEKIDVCPTKRGLEEDKKKINETMEKINIADQQIETLVKTSSQFKKSSLREGVLGTKVAGFITNIGKKCGFIN